MFGDVRPRQRRNRGARGDTTGSARPVVHRCSPPGPGACAGPPGAAVLARHPARQQMHAQWRSGRGEGACPAPLFGEPEEPE
ncbi:hypothetical protein KCH_07900 [Kitasatospora cheerisanensis KCTC 2395]|uniref:Uncharacterized protein n=1 Tax=Kitasatospora cheerisanensis KCTC 2395 TaxID=1348663 RepID=A0A066Z0V4_9ACTN|nr:hypothetical protein KCH_07900 [Kitasatospora cheerisanensis KCTC 2395]